MLALGQDFGAPLEYGYSVPGLYAIDVGGCSLIYRFNPRSGSVAQPRSVRIEISIMLLLNFFTTR